jgi:hypothetical protein
MARKKDLMQGPDVPVGGGVGGAFGERLSMSQPLAQKKPTLAPEPVEGPYYTTASGMEIVSPGQSAESIQVRQQNAERERNTPPATLPATPPPTSPVVPPPPPPAAPAKVSAFDKLRERLAARNLSSLYESVKGLIQAELPEDEFTLQLRATPAYQQRFKANAARIANGLKPLGEAEYLTVEDDYQGIMRQRGLPESYWARGTLGEQTNFEALIANDVSSDELDSRINAGQTVLNANPQVMQAMKLYYPEITNGEVLAYVINPKAGLVDIERKVRGAQIGGAALTAGLPAAGLGQARLQELVNAGVTAEQAKTGFQNIAEVLPTATKLSSIYDGGGYTQAEAEAEAFGLAGGVQAGQKRRKLASQERAAFSGQSGLSGSALERGRSGAF